MALATGTRLGTYEILGPLGAGGMGEVYRAKDLRLGREVAIKVLPANVASSPNRLVRFEREARTVAGLNHPNIVTLHSVEDEDGVRFLTMELVEGQTLSTLVAPGGLPLLKLIELAIPLTDALVAAHERGVIHRDLKPGNVMVTREGRVKVLDFGLAKMMGADAPAAQGASPTVTADGPMSGEGHMMGTVPYMAPEQLRGEAVDARSDLFSLGIILYELATGRRPFTGESNAEIASAILRDKPESLRRARADLPADLERIVNRCLVTSPRERAQSALDVSNELRRLRHALERGIPLHAASERVASIAVLPFVNRSRDEDDEYFSDGLADELLTVLSKIKGLRVTARTSSFHFKGKDTTIAEIGRVLDVATVLEGSVRKAGSRARISVQLVRVADSSHLWSETYDRTLEDIFAVQDDIAQSVVNELRSTLLGEKSDSAAGREVKAGLSATPEHSADPEAHDLYLRGRHQLNRRGDASLHRAIEFFGAAIARDPSYALAHVGLAEAHALLGFHEFEPPREAFPRARAEAIRALELKADLGEAHGLLGYTALHHDREWATAEREFLRAIELNPNHAVTRLWYLNVLLAYGRFDEALEQGRRAQELDPLSIINNLVTGWVYLFERRFELAFEKMARALELEPAFFQAHQWRGWTLWQMGRLDESAEHLEAAARLAEHPPTVLCLRAMSAAFRGRSDESRELVARMIAMRSERYVSGFNIALGFLAVGDLDAAEPWIERAADERSPWAGYLKVDPRVAALHDRPRIQAILSHLGEGA